MSAHDQMKAWMQLVEAYTVDTNPTVNDNDVDNTTTGKSGVFATVKPDRNDPHIVHKNMKTRDPAYTAYVNFLVKNDHSQQNPHFPRIFSVASTGAENLSRPRTYQPWMQSAKPKQENHVKHVTIERLPFTLNEYIASERTETYTTSTGQQVTIYVGFGRIEHLVNIYLKPKYRRKYLRVINAAKKGSYINDESGMQVQQLSDLLQLLETDILNPDHCLLESYVKALTMLREFILSNHGKVTEDIHNDNIMIRMHIIPQLVFTDPVQPYDW